MRYKRQNRKHLTSFISVELSEMIFTDLLHGRLFNTHDTI